jgi:hypothetical protein
MGNDLLTVLGMVGMLIAVAVLTYLIPIIGCVGGLLAVALWVFMLVREDRREQAAKAHR